MRAKAASVLREDPVMAALLDRHDPCDDREREPFERLCVAIVN
jgi:DNA-3-methyladenine glycosylase II